MFFCWTFLLCLFIHYNLTVMTMKQYNTIILKSQFSNLSTIKYNNIHLKSKTNKGKVQENSGKLQEERKAITEINRVYSQISPITMDNRVKNYEDMANKEKEIKQKLGYNLHGPKVIKEKPSKSGIESQKHNKLQKLKMNRKPGHFLSASKRETKSKIIERSNKTLEGATLESEGKTQLSQNSGSKYDSTTVQNIFITKTYTNKDLVSDLPSQRTLNVSQKEVWFLSNEGSDRYDCKTESTPCKNLQTVLNRASDGADIYVTSDTLSLNFVNGTVWYTIAYSRAKITGSCCLIISSLSYTLRNINGTRIDITCSSEYCC